LETVVFSNDKRQKPFIKSLLQSGIVPRALFTQVPFSPFQIQFHRQTRGFFLGSKIKEKWPSYYFAIKNGIQVIAYSKEKESNHAAYIKQAQIDYAYVFIFSMLGKLVLNAVKHNFINFHTSYLPHNRGASPSNWVLQKGLKETGYTLHYLNEKVDAGAILHQQKISLSGEETTEILNSYLLSLGTKSLIELICKIEIGVLVKEQPNLLEKGSYEKPFSKKLNYFSNQNTSGEILSIIASSSGESYSAIYRTKTTEHPVFGAFLLKKDVDHKIGKTISTLDGMKMFIIFKSNAV